MNNMNKLLNYMDLVFGFKNKSKSSIRKIGQGFDEETNEHVIQIEYRVMVSGGSVVTKQPKQNGDLIRFINTLANMEKAK